MKIAVFGATGLIGSQVTKHLESQGHDVLSISRKAGVDVSTGRGMDGVLEGVDTVVDVVNSFQFDTQRAIDFFESVEQRIVEQEVAAGVGHHVVLSIVGTDRIGQSGYMAGKLAQEQAVARSGVPFTIVRSTQFYEFMPTLADYSEQDGTIHITSKLAQPAAAEEVAGFVSEIANEKPRNGVMEFAGPERAPLTVFVERALARQGDPRRVLGDPKLDYFGASIAEDSLIPIGDFTAACTSQTEWLTYS